MLSLARSASKSTEVAHGDIYLCGVGDDADCAVYLDAVLNLDLGRARELVHELAGKSGRYRHRRC